MRQKTTNELRCFCARKPLLAVYGLDEKGHLYIHVKIYKQDRIFGEILITEGKVELHCRECLRWQRVRMIQSGKPVLEETRPPTEIAVGS